MENVADALQMAAAVLVFVLALSISINAFGEARITAQTILDNRDREYDYEYITGEGHNTTRLVKGETIIPSIYKAYRENYKIVFIDSNGNGIKLYEKYVANNSTQPEPICYIDLENEVLGTDKQKEEFLKFLLYGYDTTSSSDRATMQIFKNSGIVDLPHKNSNISGLEPLYNKIKNNTYEEKLGVYYQEELQGSSAPEANKTQKRVLTYVQRQR